MQLNKDLLEKNFDGFMINCIFLLVFFPLIGIAQTIDFTQSNDIDRLTDFGNVLVDSLEIEQDSTTALQMALDSSGVVQDSIPADTVIKKEVLPKKSFIGKSGDVIIAVGVIAGWLVFMFVAANQGPN